MIIDDTKMEMIGESDRPMIEISNANKDLPPVISTQAQIVGLRWLLNQLEADLFERRLNGSDKG